MIAVVDYCKGNLKSVERGLRGVGGDAYITDDPALIRRSDAIVLPGVGAFGDASRTMRETGQMSAIRDALADGAVFLGICLGLHLLFAEGVEGRDEHGTNPGGLAVLSGTVDKMPHHDGRGKSFKVPHVGWNSIEFDEDSCPLLEGVESGEYFYFTHSFIAPMEDHLIATTTHSVTFPSVVQAGDTIFGVQFHPEKSSDAGERILQNFLAIVENNRNR